MNHQSILIQAALMKRVILITFFRVVAALLLLSQFNTEAASVRDGSSDRHGVGKEITMKKENELTKMGKQLRHEIDETYERLDLNGGIVPQGRGRNFITDVVIKYIAAGITFSEADEILKAAGFSIQPRIANSFLPESEKYDEIAVIENYKPIPFGKVSISISLRPKGPGDFGVVQSVSAEITKTFL